MTDYYNPIEIEIVLLRQTSKMIQGVSNIEICSWPASSWLPHSAIFNIPRGDACIPESIPHRAQVAVRRVCRLEAAAMNEDCYRMRSRTRRDVEQAVEPLASAPEGDLSQPRRVR